MNGIKNARTGIYMMLAVMLVSITRRLPGTKRLSERLSTGITTLVLAAVVLLVAAGGASALSACVADDASGDAYFGGDIVMKSCTLNGSMTTAGSWGLKIGANSIVIDGNGYYIDGGTASGCTVGMWGAAPPASMASQKNPAKYSGVLIDSKANCMLKNLTIKNFCTGVAIGKGMNNTVVNCTIHDNGGVAGSTHGVHLAMTDYNTITECNISNNRGSDTKKDCGSGGSGNGIFLFGGAPAGDWNKFTHNELTNNTKAGYYSKYKCNNNEISYNKATRNGLAGIVLRAMSTYNASVHDNNASDNCGVGIYIRGNQSRFWNNTVCNNTNCSKFYPGLNGMTNPTGWGCGGTYTDCGVVSAGQVAENGGCGIVMESGPGAQKNYLQKHNLLVSNSIGGNNTICYNENWDIYDMSNSAAQDQLKGDDNKCNIAFQYKETNTIFPCDYRCDAKPVDLIVINKTETWVNVDTKTYKVHYTIANVGYINTSNTTNASIWIDGDEREVQLVLPLVAGGHRNYTSDLTYTLTGPFDVIKVCADINNTETREKEENNCTTNIFGAPDLKVEFLMTNWNKTIGAGDSSLKNFSMNYKIKNIGDVTAENVTVKFSFCTTTHNKICQNKTVNIGDLGAKNITGKLIVGQYKLPDPMTSYIKCVVDCHENLTENNEHNNFQHVQHPGACYADCGPCAGGKGGCGECLDGGCGNVNCDVDANGDHIINGVQDVPMLRQKVANNSIDLDCNWAGDVNGDTIWNGAQDVPMLISKVANVSFDLNCCPGGCPP